MNKRKHDTHWMVGVALMAAVVVVLANTPLGMIQLPIIKATTTHIPVILGALLFGPLAGGILGGIFGLCSVVSNTVAPTLLSFAFSPFMSTTGVSGALKAVWIAVGCRILIGVVAGWLWIGLKRLKVNDLVALPIVGAAGAMTNTILVMGSIYLLLSPEYAAAKGIAMDAVLGAVLGVIGSSGVLEAIGAVILVTAICKALFRVPNVRAQATAG